MNIPVEKMRTFWADLTAVVHGCVEKVKCRGYELHHEMTGHFYRLNQPSVS
jgi:hypothetical protein